MLPYQWTAVDPSASTKFLAYFFQKSFTNGLAFLLLIHLWLSTFGFFHTLFFQTDWGGTKPRGSLPSFLDFYGGDSSDLIDPLGGLNSLVVIGVGDS